MDHKGVRSVYRRLCFLSRGFWQGPELRVLITLTGIKELDLKKVRKLMFWAYEVMAKELPKEVEFNRVDWVGFSHMDYWSLMELISGLRRAERVIEKEYPETVV